MLRAKVGYSVAEKRRMRIPRRLGGQCPAGCAGLREAALIRAKGAKDDAVFTAKRAVLLARSL